jgi:hypothetical protein
VSVAVVLLCGNYTPGQCGARCIAEYTDVTPAATYHIVEMIRYAVLSALSYNSSHRKLTLMLSLTRPQPYLPGYNLCAFTTIIG